MRLDRFRLVEGPGGVVAVWSAAPVRCQCGEREPEPPTWEWRAPDVVGVEPYACHRCGGRLQARVVVLSPTANVEDLVLAFHRLADGDEGPDQAFLQDDRLVTHHAPVYVD